MTSPDQSKDVETGAFAHDEEHLSSSSSSGSSSGSTDKSSPPNTPPSHESAPAKPALGPRSNHDASYSATPPRRSKKNPPPRNTGRLGVIDEHSNDVAPDIPIRNPSRKHHMYANATKFFTFGAYSRSDNSIPPVNAYDNIVGPRGEKFQDVRRNRPFQPPNRGWRRMLCLGLVVLVLVLAIGLGVGLGVGLTRSKGKSSEDVTSPGDSDSNANDPSPFPVGTWTIPTYLTTTADNCTSQSTTWRCYPYTTYTSSNPSSSFNILTWRISSPTNSTEDLRVSNTNPTFSYPFTDVLLTLANSNDARLSAYSFDFSYRKQVVPNGDITGDGGATRCYYNGTVLSVRLYNTAEGAGGNINDGNRTTTGQEQNWPFAIEYEERIGNGPECFRYVNGQETESVSVAEAGGDCVCGYRNYGLE